MKSSQYLSLLAMLVVSCSLVSSRTSLATAGVSERATLLAVELQPEDPMPGGQFVWVLNPSQEELDLSCWVLRSQKAGASMTIPPGLRLPPGQVARLLPDAAWVGASDRVQLLDPEGQLVDETPELRDDGFDDQFWFRDPGGEWRFGRTSLPRKPLSGHLSSGSVSGCSPGSGVDR